MWFRKPGLTEKADPQNLQEYGFFSCVSNDSAKNQTCHKKIVSLQHVRM